MIYCFFLNVAVVKTGHTGRISPLLIFDVSEDVQGVVFTTGSTVVFQCVRVLQLPPTLHPSIHPFSTPSPVRGQFITGVTHGHKQPSILTFKPTGNLE